MPKNLELLFTFFIIIFNNSVNDYKTEDFSRIKVDYLNELKMESNHEKPNDIDKTQTL